MKLKNLLNIVAGIIILGIIAYVVYAVWSLNHMVSDVPPVQTPPAQNQASTMPVRPRHQPQYLSRSSTTILSMVLFFSCRVTGKDLPFTPNSGMEIRLGRQQILKLCRARKFLSAIPTGQRRTHTKIFRLWFLRRMSGLKSSRKN